ncbi:MAG: DnaA/Hda family protein [Gammaproteobacteria bacterium]|nr:DnaA/Hda family protein [Gammaproteobacteria bacterium]
MDRQYSFDNFFSTDSSFVVDSLKALIRGRDENQLGLWGRVASGKTHLMNASAQYARSRGVALQLYDADQLVECSAEDFDDFSRCDVLAVDNLDVLIGDQAWESRFYQIINRCQQGEFRFIYSLSRKVEDLEIRLPDLRSRLQWGLMLQLPESNDSELRQIMQHRARLLGIELSAEVLSYLLTHHSRNLASQMAILQTLDGVSLSQKRKVTIPLIKQALNEPGN